MNWTIDRSEPGPDLILFKARFDWAKNPRNGRQSKVVILETNDWVNVVAITPQKKIVTVRQFRFGIRKTTTEIPAGLVETGEPHEQAARRELREETGYTTDKWHYLGWVEANPAFLNNHCHFWLALDVHLTHPPDLDDGEYLTISELSPEELYNEIQTGHTRNAFTLLALSRVFDLRGMLGSDLPEAVLLDQQPD
jgi:8-oxo-dGTP pyrophosphatase MutT (NUDIX family)